MILVVGSSERRVASMPDTAASASMSDVGQVLGLLMASSPSPLADDLDALLEQGTWIRPQWNRA